LLRRSSRLNLHSLRDAHSLAPRLPARQQSMSKRTPGGGIEHFGLSPRCFCCMTCVACGELEFLNGVGWLLLLFVTNFAPAANKRHDIFGIHADASAYKGMVSVWHWWRERRQVRADRYG
jgi:hypothetical protein